ncbi:WS/DGAT domain-containing protein [Rhodococcus sp. B50]|uniref:WS/DGAT domain-containing protein n=1 Tax=Rhodococcus sp. B50 TaxID=2682847 RepID=UPI001BD3D2FC|nr:WS/DGAT domain-containing protein [Rhodococcus sp. B50]MBS9371234.1 hypothetical protein [Rhodococcus sp. B50]
MPANLDFPYWVETDVDPDHQLADTVVTNVPHGPVEGLRFGDSPAVEAIGTPMLNRNFGLVHSATSLGEVLTLSFLASESLHARPGRVRAASHRGLR